MHVRTVAMLVFLAVFVASSASPAAEHGSERGQFALAGWASVNPRTGAEHFRTIVTSGPLDGPANVEYSASDSSVITCPDGSPGQRIVEASGLTTGTLTVGRSLRKATLAASIRVTTITREICAGPPAREVVAHATVPLGFDLAGAGRRWTERSGTFIRIPSLQTSHEQARAVGRDATGTLRVGGATHRVVFGDFGRITGTWHFSAHTEEAAAQLRRGLPAAFLGAGGATETGSLRRAGATWEHTDRHGFHGVFVGADRSRGGDAVLYMDGYTATTVPCADGSRATREVLRSGEGPGRLEFAGNGRRAHAAGRVDIATFVSEGCTGETATWVSRDVVVELQLSATGLRVRSGEWVALHNPPGAPRRVFVDWRGRSAAGSVSVGAERHGATTWGEIGTLRWRQQVASARVAAPADPDFNGDGYADLAIGAPERSMGAKPTFATAVGAGSEGAVVVLYGSPTGLSRAGSQLWSEGTPGIAGNPRPLDRFGFRLAAGDFDGDGYCDLAIGKPAPFSGGNVVVLYGSRRGLVADRARVFGQATPGVPGVAHAGEWFGGALAAGDVNGDGRDDLAVGAPSDLVRGRPAGSLTMLYGSAAGLRAKSSRLITQATSAVPGGPAPYDGLGTWLAIGDLNGDGFDDVGAGTPGDWVDGKERAGSVLELHGSATGIRTDGSRLWTQDSARVGVPSHGWYQFGHRVATGDLNGDGFGDLVAGSPTQMVGGVVTGAAVVMYGSENGLTAKGAQLLSQASEGVQGVAEDPDQFGFGLSVGDLDGDGYADLVVGSPGDRAGNVVQAGAINVLFGSRHGVRGRSQLWSEDSARVPGTSAPGDGFGLDTALGDFNGDDRLDIAIGAGTDRVRGVASGAVLVLPGSGHGPTAVGSRLWTEPAVLPNAPTGEDGFGLAIAATD